MNSLLYGNPVGFPEFKGTSFKEFDEFLSEVFSKDWGENNERLEKRI
jgi:hypothetical protein